MNYSEEKFVSYLYPKVENWRRIKSDLLKYYNKEWFKMEKLTNVFGQKTKDEPKRKEMEWI